MMSSYIPMALTKNMSNMSAKSSNAFSIMAYMQNSRNVNSMSEKLDSSVLLYPQMASPWIQNVLLQLSIGRHRNRSMTFVCSSDSVTFTIDSSIHTLTKS